MTAGSHFFGISHTNNAMNIRQNQKTPSGMSIGAKIHLLVKKQKKKSR
jgi:hypothetical protein